MLTRCPACRHALDVPDAFAGQTVTCLECRAPFTAPATAGAEPVLLPRRLMPPRILVAALGLILLGGAGLVVNLYLHFHFRADPAAAEAFARSFLAQLAADKPGATKDLPEAERKQFRTEQDAKVDAAAAEWGPRLVPAQLPFAAVSAVSLAGGFAFLLRKPVWLAGLGCVAAGVNLNHGCCFPGFILGVWGLLAIISDEGRAWFRRTPVPGVN
jgi:hypothetical protein